MHRLLLLLLPLLIAGTPARGQTDSSERKGAIVTVSFGLPLLFTLDQQGTDNGMPPRFVEANQENIHVAATAGYRFHERLVASLITTQLLMKVDDDAFGRYADSANPADFVSGRDISGGLLTNGGVGVSYTLSFGDLDIEPALHVVGSWLAAPRTSIYRKRRESHYVSVETYEPEESASWSVIPSLTVRYELQDKPGERRGVLLRAEYYRVRFDDRYNVETEDIFGGRSSRMVSGTVLFNVAAISLGGYLEL